MSSEGPDPAGEKPAGDRPEPPGPGETGHGFAASAAGLLDAYADMMARLAGGAAGRTEGAAPGTPPSGQNHLPALFEAWLIASGSAMRYGQGLTEVFARHQGALLDAAALRFGADDPTQAQRLAEVEELRRFLREVGETAVLEARRLDRELEQLGEAIAQGAAAPAPVDWPWRYWATKR